MRLRCFAVVAALAAISCAGADDKKDLRVTSTGGSHDWPQWRGPDRTEHSAETGLLKSWPKEGPPLVWTKKDLGGGYSTPSVAGGRIFGMSYRDKDEVVWALDEQTGRELWAKKIAGKGSAGYNEGPRSTPTVDGDVLYTLGISGDLVCLKVENGDLVWQVNLKKEYKGNVGGWGYSESPLVDADKVIVAAGGKDATIIALDKKTGQNIWKSKVPQGDQAHYASAIVAEIGGKKQYVHFLSGGVVGVAADDGKFLWRYDHPHNGTANCSTAIYHDGCVFAASSYGVGGGLAKIEGSGDSFTADEQYFEKRIKNHHGGLVLVDGYLYGTGDNSLICIDWKTGKIKWDERKPGKGSLTYADGRLYVRNEGGKGTMTLVEANPEKYVEHGRFDQPNRSGANAWSHPVVANGKLYIRDQDVLLCYDVKDKR
jgi:outer membrane protein assembly factor BamB